jgi:ribosome biogenesis protein UTP30
MKDVQKFYKSYNDMKKLLREFTHFIVDAAIVRQLYNFLGPVFGAKHRMPIQIHCTSPSQIAGEIDKILQSSYIHLGGDNISMKIGHTKHTAQQIAENVIMGVDFLAGKIPNSWSNILSIHLRLAQSAAIPVYSKKENELVEFLQSQVKKQQAQSSSSSVSSVEEKSVQKTSAKAKSISTAANVVVTPATAVTSSVKKSAKKDNSSAAKPVEVPVSATKSKKTSNSNDSQNKKEVSTKKQAKVGARPSGIPQAGGKKK